MKVCADKLDNRVRSRLKNDSVLKEAFAGLGQIVLFVHDGILTVKNVTGKIADEVIDEVIHVIKSYVQAMYRLILDVDSIKNPQHI